jgi:hypothetical protein
MFSPTCAWLEQLSAKFSEGFAWRGAGSALFTAAPKPLLWLCLLVPLFLPRAGVQPWCVVNAWQLKTGLVIAFLFKSFLFVESAEIIYVMGVLIVFLMGSRRHSV